MVEAPGTFFTKNNDISLTVGDKSNIKTGFCRSNYDDSDAVNRMVLSLTFVEKIAFIWLANMVEAPGTWFSKQYFLCCFVDLFLSNQMQKTA
jgi:hypothetical protein